MRSSSIFKKIRSFSILQKIEVNFHLKKNKVVFYYTPVWLLGQVLVISTGNFPVISPLFREAGRADAGYIKIMANLRSVELNWRLAELGNFIIYDFESEWSEGSALDPKIYKFTKL